MRKAYLPESFYFFGTGLYGDLRFSAISIPEFHIP